MSIQTQVLTNVINTIKEDKQNILYLLYYSTIKSVLVLSIPLATSYIINSVLSHASISIIVLGLILLSTYGVITFLKVIQEYIVEKFQQKIYVQTGIKVFEEAVELEHQRDTTLINKYMNYFFDVTSVQKIFPILLLDGAGLIMKIIVSLILLLAFDPLLFAFALIIFVIYFVAIFYLGHNGVKYAIERSDAKHKSIFYLQHVPEQEQDKKETSVEYDTHLKEYVKARGNSFKVIIRQMTFTFLMEGIILSGFLTLGAYLVIHGSLPIGEFVAAEIIVVSILYSLKVFVKQIDYIYEMIEGFYKIDKLSTFLKGKTDEPA